jgi:hypothetical protein
MSNIVNTSGVAPITYDVNSFIYSGNGCAPAPGNWTIFDPVQPTQTGDTINNGTYWNGQCYYGWHHHADCNCHCMTCLLALIAALRPPYTPTTLTPLAPAPAASSAPVVDAVLKQAKDRIAEIQKKLDEVPALTSEIERLKRIVEAGG